MNQSLLTVWICTVVSGLTVTIASLFMLLRNWENTDIPPATEGLWYFSGLAFIPCFGLMFVITALRKHGLGVLLGVLLIGSGLSVGVGWSIHSGGDMPQSTADLIALITATGVSLIAGLAVIRASKTLKS